MSHPASGHSDAAKRTLPGALLREGRRSYAMSLAQHLRNFPDGASSGRPGVVDAMTAARRLRGIGGAVPK